MSGAFVRVGVVAGGVVLATTMAGCGPSRPTGGDSTARPSLVSPSASGSSLSPQAEVRDAVTAYRGMWAAFIVASNAGTTNPPDLARYASGDALTILDKGLADNKAKGLTSKGTPQITPQVTSWGPTGSPTSVTVSDCADDTHWLLYTRDGHLADSTPGGRHRVTATVNNLGGRWTVTDFAAQGPGTC